MVRVNPPVCCLKQACLRWAKLRANEHSRELGHCLAARPMQTNFLDTLQATYGPLMDAKSICRVLHYPSVAALYAARTRGKLRFKTVELDGRRGLFAATAEVATYLESQLNPSESSPAEGSREPAASAA